MTKLADLAIAPFVSISAVEVFTLLPATPTSHDFESLSSRADLRGLAGLEVAARNATSGGIAHVVRAASESVDLIGVLPTYRLLELTDGRRFVEVAVVVDLVHDLHEAVDGCIESYELVGTDVWPTPDVSIGPFDGTKLICLSAEVPPTSSVDSFRAREALTLRISCQGRPGYPSAADYEISGPPPTP